MSFDPARLFESPRLPRAPSDASELDAVAAGKKAMSMFVSSSDPDELAEWVALAAARNLVVTFHADPTLDETHVFVARSDQQWRIPAYLALWETAFVDGRWSDASENLAGHLLGYTKAQRKAWIAAQHQAFPAWTAVTVYALISAEERARVEALGRRCFGTDAELQGMSVFIQRGGVLRRTALSVIPRDHTLARVGLDLDAARALFGTATTRAMTKRLAATLNSRLLSNVQFLTKSGWR